MNTEQLILKKVKHSQVKGSLMFDVASLHEHFDGLSIHSTDVLVVEDGELVKEYIKHGDVNFDSATANEVLEVVEETPQAGMTYEEAEILTNTGHLIALPEWKGFWFKNLKTGEMLVVTKEGQIVNTPFDEFKERNDWKTVDPTEEQAELLESYWEEFEKQLKENTKTTEEAPVVLEEIKVVDEEVLTDKIEHIVTTETLNDNPELVAEGVVVGETITVDAVEEPVLEIKEEELAPEPIAEVPTPKKKRATTKK